VPFEADVGSGEAHPGGRLVIRICENEVLRTSAAATVNRGRIGSSGVCMAASEALNPAYVSV
jgi:hypothetical protein